MYNMLHRHHREVGSARDWIAQDDDRVSDFFAKTLGEQIDDPEVFLLTALIDSHVVGFVRVVKRTIEGFSEEHAYMDPMIVSPDVRSKGIGTRLFREGVEWSQQQNLGSIWLDVWEENERPRRMYEREGFRTVSRSMAMKF
jgi:ribosomal protein S18 acetylase RimI-like enzyme